MNSPFAYSSTMQMILFFIIVVVDFSAVYLTAEVVSVVFKTKVTKTQKALFALSVGVFFDTFWVYGAFCLNGMQSFTQIQYLLIVSPNPIQALVYCFCAIRFLGLPSARSIKVMSYVYLFWVINRSINRVLSAVVFIQSGTTHNYLLDATEQIIMLIIFNIFSYAVMHAFKKNRINLNFADNRFFYKGREWFYYFLKLLCFYSTCVIFPISINNQKVASITVLLIQILFFVILALWDKNSYKSQIIEHNNVHISTLFKGTEEIRGIKHDFNNILQTYSGYLELGNLDSLKKYHATLISATKQAGASMELGQRMDENPALVSLVINKVEYAEKSGIDLQLSIECSLRALYIDHIDLCRALGCLLDNAIEAAATSIQKKVCFSAESNDCGVIFIITNSTLEFVDIEKIMLHGVTSKAGHSGIGLTTVRKSIEKYGNCVFHTKYFNNEVSAYLEIKRR